MTPIITDQDPETGEWEIVTDHDDEESTMDQLIAGIEDADKKPADK